MVEKEMKMIWTLRIRTMMMGKRKRMTKMMMTKKMKMIITKMTMIMKRNTKVRTNK